MVQGLNLAGYFIALLALMVGVVAMIAFHKMKHPLELLRLLLIGLTKLGLLVKPKTRAYMVEARVMLDGKLVDQLPVEVMATSRLAAKFITNRRLRVVTGTESKTVGYNESNALRAVDLTLLLDEVIVGKKKVIVEGYTRREAKFDITNRIQLKAGNAARKQDLIKYVRNERV